jgi:Ca2+-transporting ATPase
MGEKGLRVLAFAARLIDDADCRRADDPMALTATWPSSAWSASSTRCGERPRAPSRIALAAGIDVRMITGDHAITARAIGETLGLGAGAISGAELQALTDEELASRLPELHVFGRVSPRTSCDWPASCSSRASSSP